MKKIITVLFFLLSIELSAQLNVVSSNPVNNSLNVPTTTTLSLTFNSQIDTSFGVKFLDHFFTNVDSIVSITPSSDLLTLNFSVILSADHYYYFLLNSTKSLSGDFLSEPFLLEFTTGANFSGVSVSGTVSVSSSEYTIANSLIALSLVPISNDEPIIMYAAIADSQGNYVVNHVEDGKYFPIGVKDVAAGPGISPEEGDMLGVADSIIVSGTNLTGIDFQLFIASPITLTNLLDNVDSTIIALALPSDLELKFIDSWRVDSTGSALGWDVKLYSPGQDKSYSIDIDFFDSHSQILDSVDNSWISSLKTIDRNNIIDPAVFLANCDINGGKQMRDNPPDSLEFVINLTIGQLSSSDYWELVPDDSLYLAASYMYIKIINQDSVRVDSSIAFVGDIKTGVLIITSIEDNQGNIPSQYVLNQNYPNPFNPSTNIEFILPQSSFVKLEIYNLIGQKVATLLNRVQNAGMHTVNWSPKLSSGIYFYKLEAMPISGSRKLFVKTKKMILIK